MRRAAPVFVDTAYFVALLNARDKHHAAAVALAARWHRLDTKLLTCDAVVVETYNWFARSPIRRAAATALSALRGATGWAIVHASAELISRGQSRFASHDDKTWSLTDCISMEVASDHGATQVATTDAHFEQAGFEILLGSPA
jgi:predicted nucleic acid-binding protein